MIGKRPKPPVTLTKASDAELKAELAKREAIAKKVPDLLLTPDFNPLITMVHQSFLKAVEDDYLDEDFDHYVWECVMKTLYGPKFFDWYNKSGLHR